MPTAKKSTKKQNIFSKLNTKSPKTRGLILLLAFALVGGGVMVYRSFAYSATSIYTVGNGNLVADVGARPYSLTGANGKVVETVMVLNPSKATGYIGGKVIVSTSALGILANQKFKLCITQTGGNFGPTGTSEMLAVLKDGTRAVRYYYIGGANKNTTTVTSVGGSKTESCTPVVSYKNELRGPVILEYRGNTTINLSAFTIYQVEN